MREAIERIRLWSLLPQAFAAERGRIAGSEIYLTEQTLTKGKHYSVQARSGGGKTTLCSYLFGVRKDYEGNILFNDTDIKRYDTSQWCAIRREHIAYVPQELDLFDELTAMENVLLKNRLTDYHSEAEIRAMFERLEIDNRMGQLPRAMSVGQKQRVAIIRALCQPFDFILMDEPVSHLDEESNAKCGAMISEQAKRNGGSVVFTSVGNALTIDLPMQTLRL